MAYMAALCPCSKRSCVLATTPEPSSCITGGTLPAAFTTLAGGLEDPQEIKSDAAKTSPTSWQVRKRKLVVMDLGLAAIRTGD
jgi:hypothetical protein